MCDTGQIKKGGVTFLVVNANNLTMEKLKDDELMSKSWKKVYETATKEGYREGITAGRESIYQKSFDIGYAEGFRNAFPLGLYKSLLSSKHQLAANDLLQKTMRGNCEICKNNDLLNRNTAEVVNLQTISTKNVLETLKIKYNVDIKSDL